MTFILRRTSPYVIAFFPFGTKNDHDKTDNTEVIKTTKDLTGVERVKNMFYKDEHGMLSPELQYCIHLSTMGLVVGLFYGAVIRGRSSFIKFIDSNEATMFRNHLDAKRQLQDVMALSIGKGAFQWGWRMFFFTSIYGLTATIVSVFRGKSGILEHADGGFLAGAIYNMKNGYRGVIVGGGLGSILGTIFGSVSYGILWLTGNTMEDVRFYTHEWKKGREELIHDTERKNRIRLEEEEILKVAHRLTEKEDRIAIESRRM